MKIWWYKDNKIGHNKQVSALLNELAKQNQLSIKKIDCKKSIVKDCLKLMLSYFSLRTNSQDVPDVLIGAGHDTYLKMVADKNRYGDKVKSIAILKPSFLKENFDLICAPEHDFNKPTSSNVFMFKGSLAKVIDTPPQDDVGLIAIGGINKHYTFDANEIIKQIDFILSLNQQTQWFIYNSRRTPEVLNNKLGLLEDSNIKFINANDPATVSLDEIIAKAKIKFVTPDSVNLVFESLSSGGETYLLNMQPNKVGKITTLMDELVAIQDVGILERSDMTSVIKTYKLKQPNKFHQIYAEVEKVSFKITQLIQS